MMVVMMMKMARLVVVLMLESNLLEFVVWPVAYPESSMRDLVRWPCSPARDGCGYR